MKIGTCTIIKDELEYIEEWIQYNISIGITDIYLYEDFNSISHKDITDKYPQCHLFSIETVPFADNTTLRSGSWRQVGLYKWFVKQCNANNIDLDWCAFIDPDEYIVFEDGYDLIKLLEEYKNYPGIYLFWNTIGASGHIYKPIGKIQDNYKIPGTLLERDNGWNYKSIINFQYKSMNFGHRAPHEVRGGVNTSGIPTYKIESFKKCWINHYFTKSLEDWIWQIYKRGDLSTDNRKVSHFFECNPDLKDKEYLKYEIIRKYYDTFKSDELVSVCMCTYNRADYLNLSIASIIYQTYDNIEFIIVDDGSTDNSKEILEYWKNKDPRIKVIYSDHDFIKSRNLSYQNASGKYIVNMDSDDLCSIDRIEKLYKYLQKHPNVDLVGSIQDGFDYPEEHDDIVKSYNKNYEMVIFGSILFRRNILNSFKNNIYFFKEFYEGGEDTIWKICLLNHGYKFANILELLYLYIRSESSLTLSESKNNLFKRISYNRNIKNMKKLVEDFLNSYPIDDIDKFLEKYNISKE